MTQETVKIPDIGGAEQVEVIEISVAVGDRVAAEDSLLVLESDKASMEVPSPRAGKVTEVLLSEGDNVSQGDSVLVLELDESSDDGAEGKAEDKQPAAATETREDQPEPREEPAEAESASAPASSGETTAEEIPVPDIGTDEQVEVIEVSVAEGDEVQEGDSLIVLESDKASMEVPSPRAGKVLALRVSEGDRVRHGDPILELAVSAGASSEPTASTPAEKPGEHAESAPAAEQPESAVAEAGREAPQPASPREAPATVAEDIAPGEAVYAGPAVRKLAREFSIPLTEVRGSGPRGRILKEDLQRYVKNLANRRGPVPVAEGSGIPAVPAVDFSRFGEIDEQPLSNLQKLTAANMHRSWLNVPHVTQIDEADVTGLEEFRQSLKSEAERRGVKLTPLPFLLKASAAVLRAHPKFNASLHPGGEHIIYKKYVHIGIAVDTPAGLMVPVVRDVDRKSIWDLAAETAELAQKARDRQLRPEDMQGGCFTISSLGNIGGQGFTPVINTPEVAILGVSRLSVKPVWDGNEFVPRKLLPLSLSYDHRAVNGADAGRFLTELNEVMSDIRRLVL